MEYNNLIEKISKIDCLKLVHHNNDSGFINVKCTISNDSRRFNVIGDLNPKSCRMVLYSDGKWLSNRKLGINNFEAVINWIKKDIQLLSKLY